MKKLKLILWLALLLQQKWLAPFVGATSTATKSQSSIGPLNDNNYNNNNNDVSASSVLGSLYRKSRQSRCVRCYEDRYGGDDRSRYSGYSSRSADDRGNWYYPSYDRYDDRQRGTERDNRYYYNTNRGSL